MGSLPDFLIVGAQKAATTSLWAHLRSSPDVFMPELKEPNYFVKEANWSLGLDWYRSLFSEKTEGQIAGEASTGYSVFPVFTGVPERIAAIVPDVKIIYLIREPVDRMVSSWLQWRADGHDDRPLQEAVLRDTFHVFQSGYATQLERYLEYFDRDAILVLRSDDLAADPAAALTAVCSLIGADPGKLTDGMKERHNVSAHKLVPRRRALLAGKLMVHLHRNDLWHGLMARNSRLTHRALGPQELQLDDEVRQNLRTYLLPEMERLRRIVGPEMDLWGYA